MYILVVNSGSSSIKFQLLDMATERPLASGLLEAIGSPAAVLHLRSTTDTSIQVSASDHSQALGFIFKALDAMGFDRPQAIGHRVVHGGERFQAPVLLTPEVISQIKAISSLAPLHNPANLLGIAACQQHFPGLPQVAVFDTAFHQTMPETAWRYAVPDSWYLDYGVRRYGFHGSSHAFVCRAAARWLGKPLQHCNLISLHLGNGASITAVEQGRSVDTSMGMTPLEGLVMGSRAGDIDPAIHAYLGRTAGLGVNEVERQLNQASGLKALCGDNDMRRILARAAAGDKAASLALDIYVRRIRKYLGAYMLLLGRVDAMVFTGGIGENAAEVRAHICRGLDAFGIRLDVELNQSPWQGQAAIHQLPQAKNDLALLVIATNEELEIARQVAELIGSHL
jgi:acetate kinase